jgi:hypothetical protein
LLPFFDRKGSQLWTSGGNKGNSNYKETCKSKFLYAKFSSGR